MKINRAIVFAFIVITAVIIGGSQVLAASQVTKEAVKGDLIINHNSTDLEKIPEAWIKSAKANLHIAYGHTSHGSQLISGMTGLENFKGKLYSWNEGGKNGALDIDDAPFSVGDLGSGDWASATRKYLTTHPKTNVIIWSWCGQVSGASETYISSYLNNMNKLEKDYPKVIFVYMTGHLDGTGLKGNLNLRNEQIRKYCKVNKKILYDFADIESYNPDGVFFADKYANDNCDYDSNGDKKQDKNWAKEWQSKHKLGVDWYSSEAAHSQAINGNQKAYAAWWLWAKLAGWDGKESVKTNKYAPILKTIGSKSVIENKRISLIVSATDADAGTLLKYSATGLPKGAIFNATTRTFSWTPSLAQSGKYTVRFTVSDGKSSDYENVVITVINVEVK